MQVIYRGKKYQVLFQKFCGFADLYTLASRTQDGSPFPAKKNECRPAKAV